MRSIVIGTAGHIDHGKSALVRALTGTDPDRLKEEQERGITIDLGFAHLLEGDTNLAFVDVPGHERFVKNMLAGAGGVDLVMLVVAADESVMPQTREHFHICRLLRVPAGIIVLTKTDVADAETVDVASMEVRDLVQGSFLGNAPIVPVSSRTGDGLDRLRGAIVDLANAIPAREASGPVRLPIDRVFSLKGFGTVTTGTLVSGTIREDAELVALPGGRGVKVRGLQVHGRRESSATAGRRVAVNLGGVDVEELSRGDTLTEADAFEPSRRLDVVMELLADARPLRHGARVRFHSGTTELLGRVALAGGAADAASASSAGPFAERSPVYARIRLESQAVVTRGDRFILRAYSPVVTIGGGAVLDPQPARGSIRRDAALDRFRRLDPVHSSEDDAICAFIEDKAGAGVTRLALRARSGLPGPAVEQAVARLATAGKATVLGDLIVSPSVLDALAERLVRELASHHATSALSEGMPREEARDRIFRRAHPAVFERVLETLSAAKRIVRPRPARACGPSGIAHAAGVGGAGGDRTGLSRREAHAAGPRCRRTGDRCFPRNRRSRRRSPGPQQDAGQGGEHALPRVGAGGAQGEYPRAEVGCGNGARRRGFVQGALWSDEEVRDPAARVSGSRAGHPQAGGDPGRALTIDVVAAVGFLEVLDALADAAPDLGQPAGAEDQHDQEQNDD